MIPLNQVIARLERAMPGVPLEVVPNGSPGNPPSLRVSADHGRAVAQWLRDDPALRLDFASNVTGVDWPERTVEEPHRFTQVVNGVEREFEETRARRIPGYLEVVYHLFSIERKHGPLVLRLRTPDRATQVRLPSLTPVWRSCELQEREIYDLFGVVFDGHPDLRRLLMWEGYRDHPMRKDYVPPDDFEYEPTPHDEVLARARQHAAPPPAS
jgi:NADH-quinone oxidoreductase subunit C